MSTIYSVKIAVAAVIVAVLGLLTLVVVLVIDRNTGGSEITISVDDLAEMKSLVHEYLNERERAVVSNTPQDNANIASAPIIGPSEMSPELAERQKEDVAELLVSGNPRVFSDFAIYTKVLDIREEGDELALLIRATTFFRNNANPDKYSSTATDRYFTFTRKGDVWVLTDAKLTSTGTMPPDDEPSVEPNEKGTSRVLADPPELIREVPEEIERLDVAATQKIMNKWATNEKAVETYSQK